MLPYCQLAPVEPNYILIENRSFILTKTTLKVLFVKWQPSSDGKYMLIKRFPWISTSTIYIYIHFVLVLFMYSWLLLSRVYRPHHLQLYYLLFISCFFNILIIRFIYVIVFALIWFYFSYSTCSPPAVTHPQTQSPATTTAGLFLSRFPIPVEPGNLAGSRSFLTGLKPVNRDIV